MRSETRLLVTMALAVGIAGCGGSRTVHFPVDHSKTMPTLTADELKAMCNEMLGEAKDAVSVACLAQAVVKKFSDGGSEQLCQTTYQQCMSEFQAKVNEATCELADASKLQSCNVTVGEYETCTNDMLAYIDRMSSKLSCSMSMADLQSLEGEMKTGQPPSCTALAPKCPELFDQDDTPQP